MTELISGITPREYLHGIVIGNIVPNHTDLVAILKWADDEIRKCRPSPAFPGAGVRDALEQSITAIDDWLHLYAGEFCNPGRVAEAEKRVGEYGTLHYIATVQKKNCEALAILSALSDRAGQKRRERGGPPAEHSHSYFNH